MRNGQTNGIAVVANDKIVDWLLPFLESYRETNGATQLFIIPYDDNTALTRRAADIYGATWVEDEMAEIDDLGKRLYPLSPYRRRRLRKLQVLALPVDKVIYLDVDIILFRDLGRFFDCLDPGATDFIVASRSDD